MRTVCLFLLYLPALLKAQQQQYDLDEIFYNEQAQYSQYDSQFGNSQYNPDFDYPDATLNNLDNTGYSQSQLQVQQQIIPAPTTDGIFDETEPTEPGPLDCREEQYPCTRLYSVHKPCRQCLKSLCFYSLRRVYVINKEVCIRTVCAHEELLRADLCRDKFSKCGVMAHSGLCGSMGSSCAKSCGGC
ncbi:microfibrillar-associated protein 2 [Latimeria chalumnae]|uniref:Microfibril associated protein 2 n=1 Tax=Latimeria chalumnae TaxID=7897 RepID=H3B742_LATCH|nr:PREDICTED: microfibrillar-associated protein 2 [Latimeria chalumnae]|eukprot:XP_005996362.1 PREDICTED: microfibrillar-associated protein 2 [Latimeria chalumnae]